MKAFVNTYGHTERRAPYAELSRHDDLMFAGILAWKREQRLARLEKRRANTTLPRRRGPANRGGRCGRPLRRAGAQVMTLEEKERWGHNSIGLRNWRKHLGLCYYCGLGADNGELSCAECRANNAARNRDLYQRQRLQRRRAA